MGSATKQLAAFVLFTAAVLAATVPAHGSRAETVPPSVKQAVAKFEPKAQQVVATEADFARPLGALPRADAACEQPLARGPLAGSLTAGMAPLMTDTKFAEKGELQLYPLSRALQEQGRQEALCREPRRRR